MTTHDDRRPRRQPAAALAGLAATALTTLALTGALAPDLAAQGFTRNFDGISAPGAFSQIFPGGPNGPLLEDELVTIDGGVILIDALFNSTATSGDNILATCDSCGLGDGPPPTGLPGMISGSFTSVVDSLELDAINGVAAPGNFTLTAFGPDGGVVATDTVNCGPSGSLTQVQHLAVTAPAIRSFTVTTSLGFGYTFAIDTVEGNVVQGDWANLGQALAGTNGLPRALGTGTLFGGDPVTVTLVQALPNTTAAVILGFSELSAPFEGGVLVPFPDRILFFPTDGSGTLSGTTTWPEGVPSGTELYVQFWIVDPGGPVGLAASNALRATAP